MVFMWSIAKIFLVLLSKPVLSDEPGSNCDPLTQSCIVGHNSKEETRKETSEASRSPHKPLNVLLLYADDWRHDSLGSVSGGVIKTPFLDSMAADGMRFSHNCVTTAICWVSRATLYTGQWLSRHKSPKSSKPIFYNKWANSFVRMLQTQAGYYVGHVGKWHYANFDRIEGLWNFSRAYHGHHWYSKTTANQSTCQPIHVTKRNEKDALKFLRERPKDQPFYLEVCFFAPHAVDEEKDQYFPQPTSMEWYTNDTISKAISATTEAWESMPSFFTNVNTGRVRWGWRFNSEEKYQSMMKNYFRLITEIDETSRRIVNELEVQDVLNETLVIFTTDNGYFHGEHGLADKWYPHQESIRVPLIIKDPRMKQKLKGTTKDEFTLSVDLASTILRAANLEQHPRMQGRDIAELYLEGVDDWRRDFYYEHPTVLGKDKIPGSTALVMKDWKLMRWTDFGIDQLFALKSDPYELNDVIESYKESSLLEDLRFRHDSLKEMVV